LAKIRPTVHAARAEREGLFAAWLAFLKKGIAEIAATKSLQQFGREEEKQK
jgi:hypothetical protein